MALILFVLLTASLVGALSQWSARSIIESRMLTQELPNTIKQINGEIDKEISLMRTIAQQIATSFINQSQTCSQEIILFPVLANLITILYLWQP